MQIKRLLPIKGMDRELTTADKYKIGAVREHFYRTKNPNRNQLGGMHKVMKQYPTEFREELPQVRKKLGLDRK